MRIGVIGAGYWAEQVHIAVLREHPGVSLAGLWGRDPAKARAVAARAGVLAFDSFEALLAEVEAVSFAVPPDAQAALATRAAAAGKHLVLEKPLALSLDDAEALVRAIEGAGVASVVFLTRRFTPEVEQALAGIAGERVWETATSRLLAGALRPGTPYFDSAWRHEHGALWDLGPHVLSVLTAVLGDVATVSATRDAARVTWLRLVHVDGGRSEVAMSLHADPADHGEEYVFRAGPSEAPLILSAAPRFAAYGGAVDALLTSARTGVPHVCDASFGLRIQRVLAAAQASLDGGGEVAVRG
jgi:predicted dehydrogenase